MNRLDARLADVLEPVRDVAVAELLEVMSRRLDEGADVKAEPQARDLDGCILREGPLQLPRRGDLSITQKNRTLIQKIESHALLTFCPVTLIEPEGFVAVIAPFRWDAAQVIVQSSQSHPNWAPVRRWFLEWFQSRYSDVAPDLDGAVHCLRGPDLTPDGWRLVIDFGSAPIDCISDLIGALVQTGAGRVTISTPDD